MTNEKDTAGTEGMEKEQGIYKAGILLSRHFLGTADMGSQMHLCIQMTYTVCKIRITFILVFSLRYEVVVPSWGKHFFFSTSLLL